MLSPRHIDLPAAHPQISEIGEILSAGLIRLWRQKSTGKPQETREGSLDFSTTVSGHPTSPNRETVE